MVEHRRGADRRALLASAAALALGAAIPGASLAQTKLGKTFDEIVAGAKSEGKLTAWIVAPRSPATHKALIDAFNKRFGLNTQVEWVPNPPLTSNTRAITEAAGGNLSVDIIGGASIEGLPTIADAKLVSAWPWGEVFGTAMPAIKELEALVMPKYRGYGLPYQTIAYGICWNPNMIADADVPSRLSEFGDPKWKGKFAFNAFLPPLDIVSYAIGNDATIELARKIFANMPVYARGTPAVASAVTTGSVPLGIIVSPVAETLIRNKEPLKFKLFSDIVPVTNIYLTVPDLAPHPNTARLFAAWLTAEGSAVGDPFEPMTRPGETNVGFGQMIAAAQKAGATIASPTTEANLTSSAKLMETLLQMQSGQAK